MIRALESLYDATLRRIGPIHRLLRLLVWNTGDILVKALSPVVRFELPPERLMPLYKIQFLLGTYEADTVRLCRRLVQPGMTVMDVGAHVGYYALLLSRLVGPSGRVLAFEPDPANFELLGRNVQARGAANVQLFRCAVTSREGSALLWQTPLSAGHSLLPVKPERRALTVETVTLDGVCARQGVERVDLIKMDVEGAEPDVLGGMRELSGRYPGVQLILEFKAELFARRGLGRDELWTRLSACGFTDVAVIGRRGRLCPLAGPEDLSKVGKANLLAQRRASGFGPAA